MNSEDGGAIRVALSLSAANLIYLRVWFDLLTTPSRSLSIRHGLDGLSYCAALLNVVSAAAVIWLCLRFAYRMRPWVRQALVLIGLMLTGNAIRGVASAYTPLLRSGAFHYLTSRTLVILAGVVVCAVAYRLVTHFTSAIAFLRIALLVCLPIVPITCGTAVVRAISPPVVPVEPALTARINSQAKPHPRVIWVIFDEWDNRLTFGSRIKGVALPALDELAARSLVGSRVLGPQGRLPVAQMATEVAIPSLLAGEVRKANDFAAPNLFSKVHSRGWNVAIGGWYIPYCRLFAAEAFRCYWDQMYTQSTAHGASLGEALTVQERSLFETSMFSVFGQSFTSERHAAEYRAIRDFALDVASDSSADLVFLHFNTPHAPYFYNAKANRFDASGRGISGYGDALVLVDRTVAELMKHLDSNTALLLSADHPLRIGDQVDGITDPHVPFIVHFPGQTNELRDEQEFSSLGTAPLIVEILSGTVRTAEEAAAFLDRGFRSSEH